jgi:hypothetical protein
MQYLRVLHNGDLRKETLKPSPHWMVHVGEDGHIWGEVLTRDWGRMLPNDFRLPDHKRFFEIPPALGQHQLAKPPHHEEIIVSLVRRGGFCENSFLMSQLPADSPLRGALTDLVRRIQEVVEQGPPPKT